MKKLITFTAIVLSIASCSSFELAQPNQTDLAWAQNKYENVTMADLSQGKVLFEKNCALCHSLKRSIKRTEAELIEYVPDMVSRANEDNSTKKIDVNQEQQLLQYLVTLNSVEK